MEAGETWVNRNVIPSPPGTTAFSVFEAGETWVNRNAPVARLTAGIEETRT